MCQIKLYIPKIEELWYRQRMMEDPKTMEYNKGYFLDSKNYNNDTGCILFPKEIGKNGMPVLSIKNLNDIMLIS